MESIWPIFVVLLIVVLLTVSVIITREYWDTRKADANDDAIASLRQIDATSDADLSDGQRRAKRIPGRPQVPLVPLQIIALAGRSQESMTYWATYEMIIRGLQVTLEMLEIQQEDGGFGVGKFSLVWGPPKVVSRTTYTTEAFIPHLRAIDSFEAFGRYAPFRSNRTMNLSAHPDDLTDAYALLRELGIRLSVMHHPDQHWWKDEGMFGDSAARPR